MHLERGSRLGPYEIISPLGAGGMGEVYRARDTRLDRTVAIKVLSRNVSSSPDMRQRFEREAKTISQLSHPHICALYDVGQQGDVPYLVMEYIEGELLSKRLDRGALPFSQALRFGMEIADALFVAHRRGIVHRDLKPSNVMLSTSGVKLLDFGLAKAIAGADPVSNASATRTDITGEGAIVGTIQYMAPEQLEATETDARTDIFALGAVLYEMATGKKAFNGASQASLISVILKDDPTPIATFQPLSPPSFERVVKTCLAKDAEDRWQSARDVAHELRAISESSGSDALTTRSSRARKRERVAWTALALTTLAALLFGLRLLRQTPEPAPAFVSTIQPPEDQEFNFGSSPPAVSPDGSRIAFSARPRGGTQLLWVRSFDATSAQPLAGTEGARGPFWSPDGRSLGFFAAEKLKRIDLDGGVPTTLADAAQGKGGSWSRDGDIIFVPRFGYPVYRIAATGGVATPVTDLDPAQESGQASPQFLPDGRHFLYASESKAERASGIWVGDLDSKDRTFLVESRSHAVFAPSSADASKGYLLFLKGRTLLAQPFDATRLQLVGDAIPVADQVTYLAPGATGVFSVSQNGVLAHGTNVGNEFSQLVWFDRTGKRLQSIDAPAAYYHPRISHDGRRVAYVVEDPRTVYTDIWVHDLVRRASTRLTFGPKVNIFPVWSPDDRRIVFSSNRRGAHGIFQRQTSGGGDDEFLYGEGADAKFAVDYSPVNGLIALQSWNMATKESRLDIELFSPTDRKATTLLSTAFNEWSPQFSPDGQWLAYVSNESGRDEVYVRSQTAAGTKVQVSISGGDFPRWSRDGKEIFFLASGNSLMTAEVTVSSVFTVGVPKLLFRAEVKWVDIGYPYDVAPDGKRFLVNVPEPKDRPASITVVQNWTSRLKR